MHELVTELPQERITALYESLEERAQRALDGPIGKALNSRPQTVAKRPQTMRVKALRAYILRQRDDDLSAELLRSYLLGPRKDLVTGFLDGVGIEHEEGSVEGDDEPAADKVGPTVEALLEEHDAGDVLLYLEVASRQWPESAAVQEALEAQRSAASSAD